jgi:Protein of unknown function (DUF3040)
LFGREFPDPGYRDAQPLPRLALAGEDLSGDDPWGGTVPLSEEELRLLEQMERALVEEDPKFASTLRGTAFRRSARRRAIIAGVFFAIGVAVLMTGAVAGITLLGIAGFVVMLGSATVALAAMRGQHGSAAPDPRAGHPSRGGFTVIEGGRRTKRSRSASRGSFMDRMADRWSRRRENGGY